MDPSMVGPEEWEYYISFLVGVAAIGGLAVGWLLGFLNASWLHEKAQAKLQEDIEKEIRAIHDATVRRDAP